MNIVEKIRRLSQEVVEVDDPDNKFLCQWCGNVFLSSQVKLHKCKEPKDAKEKGSQFVVFEQPPAESPIAAKAESPAPSLKNQMFRCKQCGLIFYTQDLQDHSLHCENKHIVDNKIVGGQYEPMNSDNAPIEIEQDHIHTRRESAFQCKYCYNIFTSSEAKKHECPKKPEDEDLSSQFQILSNDLSNLEVAKEIVTPREDEEEKHKEEEKPEDEEEKPHE